MIGPEQQAAAISVWDQRADRDRLAAEVERLDMEGDRLAGHAQAGWAASDMFRSKCDRLAAEVARLTRERDAMISWAVDPEEPKAVAAFYRACGLIRDSNPEEVKAVGPEAAE